MNEWNSNKHAIRKLLPLKPAGLAPSSAWRSCFGCQERSCSSSKHPWVAPAVTQGSGRAAGNSWRQQPHTGVVQFMGSLEEGQGIPVHYKCGVCSRFGLWHELLVTGSSVLCQALPSWWLRPRPSCHSGASLGQSPVTATSASSSGMRCWTFDNPWN